MVDRRLGRGLDFFLSGNRPAATPPPAPPVGVPRLDEPSKATRDEVQLVELDRLSPNPHQPRRNLEGAELEQLAESIRSSGIIQPILARRIGDRLELVAGERRWRAAKLAGLSHVPVLVRSIEDNDSAVLALVENLQREDLNAIEKALGFRLLMERLAATQEDVARKVGLDRSTVANFLRLLELPDEVQAHVSRGTLSMGHARCLLALTDPESINDMATTSIKESLSVRVLEQRVKDRLASLLPTKAGGATAKAKASRPVWVNELEESLVESLGSPVHIRYGRKRSSITIECGNRDDFERVYQRLKNA